MIRPDYNADVDYHLKSEVSIVLCFQLYSTHCTAVQINSCLKRTSAIKGTTMKITNNFCYIMCYHQIDTFAVSTDEGGHKE